MDGDQELPPIGEREVEQVKIPVHEVEKDKVQSLLSSKLNQVRANARTHTEKVLLLSRTLSSDIEIEDAMEAVSFDSLSPQLDELTQAELSPAEYLMRSKQLLDILEQVKKRALIEHEEAQRGYYSHRGAIRDVDYKLEDLRRLRGIKRFTSIFERRRLAQQRFQLEGKASELQTRADSKRQLVDRAYEREKPIRKKQEEVFLNDAVAEIVAIRSVYEKFLGEVISEGTILGEIQNAYIKFVITPLVDEVAEWKKLPDDKKDAFYSALRNCLQHNDASEEEKQTYRQELDRVVYEDGLYSVKDACRPILYGEDEGLITKFVGKIAASDLAEIKAVITANLSGYDSRYRLDRVLEKAVDPEGRGWRKNDGSFREIVLVELNQRVDGNYPNMRLWRALKSSPVANEIFGDLIQVEDDKIYATALERSLSDTKGGDIDVLSYYPTPEAIRNVVILAAADYSNYRTVHANGVLISFARRNDWKDLLDKAEQVYPALRSARPVLEEWRHGDQSNNQQIQEAVKDFALSLIEGDQDIAQLKGLATAALPNHSLLEVLNKRGVVSEAELSILGEAESFIDRVSEERRQKIIRDNQDIRERDNEDIKDIPYIDSYSLKNAIRQNLFNLMYSRQGEDQGELGSMRRLVTLSRRILDNQTNYSSLSYLASAEIVEVIANKRIQPELLFAFPEQAKPLMDEKMKETRAFIFEHGETLLKDATDLRFLSNVVGEFGQKSDSLIRGYQECLDAGVITHRDRQLVLEFVRQFRVISPTTLGGYKEAKEAGHEKVYIAQLTALAEKMTGSGAITDEERAKPVYKDLLKHVYSNNSGQWSSFESNESCADRRSDIAEFKIRTRYEIDLLSQSEIRVKAREALDPRVQEEAQKPIFAISERMSELGYDYDKIKDELRIAIDGSLEQIIENGGLRGLDLSSVTSPEERLFLVLSDSIYGTRTLDKTAVKNLLITYEFTNFEDISDYIAGTRDRVGRASNQDYALLCEVGAFYSDRIKEVNRRLVEAAWNNPTVAELMPEYFKKLAQEIITSERQDRINRLQVDRLGLSDSFVKQVGKVLEKRKGRKYEPDEVREIIRRYEGITGGLSEKASTSKNPQTKAFYGQLRSQREKTFEALGAITGESIDPSKVHLGEVNLQQVLDVEANIREGKYDEDQFASYTVQRFIDLFDGERTKIEGELDKFESLSGKQREVLYANITKAKEAAHARMVGGVCVAGDNPDKYPDQNMWNMPNYFQLVFQEPDTLQCQGLVLLHHFTEGGKKVLTASVNPSSTYLYSVDEAALFTGIMGTLEQFASENGFDLITLSQNKGIRTNRTGGQFEKAMNERIAQVGKTFRFDAPQQFSYHPNYQLQDMDVVWENSV